MKEDARVIIENACVLTGAPNTHIRPTIATLADSNNDEGREEIQAAVSLPTTTQRDTKEKKQNKHKTNNQPMGTLAQVEHNEAGSETPEETRQTNNRTGV